MVCKLSAVLVAASLAVPFAAPVASQNGNGNGEGAQSGAASFPKDLLPVPGGSVQLGTTANELLDITKEFVPRQTRRRADLLRKLMSELGDAEREVDNFLLYRTPITNEQYLEFVKRTGYRFPYHWWKDGKNDHYEEMRPKFTAAFKGQKNAGLLYWEKYWNELPYAIPEGAEKMPVTFVSWNDAQAFAGWAGMRLPTEAEWVRAAGDKPYVFGEKYDRRETLKLLRLSGSRDQVLKPVGAIGQVSQGPYGHIDMVGQVWEWCDDVGFYPVSKEFDREKRKLEKSKAGKGLMEIILGNRGLPDWRGTHRILKGGSYFSWRAPDELRVKTRAHIDGIQTLEGVGFRVAKSLVPARDMCRSRIRVEYDYSMFGGERQPNVEDQVGLERYALSADGKLIQNYHAIAVVPVSDMGWPKNYSNDKIKEMSRQSPLIVGTLVSTEPIAEPKLEPGMYTIYLRERGMPKELVEALRDGSKVLLAEKKAKEREKRTGRKSTPKPAKPKKGDEGKADWRTILKRYGITHEEATVASAHKKIDFVRVKPGDYKVTTEKPTLLIRKNGGDFVAHVELGLGVQTGSVKPAALGISTDKKGNEQLDFSWGVPQSSKVKRGLTLKLRMHLASPPDVTRPWRSEGTLTGPDKSAVRR